MEILLALIAIFASIWVFADARKRDVNIIFSLFWMIATLFLFIVFLPLWFFVRPSEWERSDTGRIQSICPYCRQLYEGTPSYCPNCGQRLRSEPHEGTLTFCPICEGKVYSGADVCPHCGVPLQLEEKQKKDLSQVQNVPHKYRLWQLIPFLMATIGILMLTASTGFDADVVLESSDLTAYDLFTSGLFFLVIGIGWLIVVRFIIWAREG